jgi:folate-dependent phosphoribosylglycinamide formyltransferase PurN
MTLRIGWFSTGAGQGSQRWRLFSTAIDEIRGGRLDAEIAFLFCNRERGEDAGTDSFLDLAESQGIRCLTLSSRRFRKERHGALSAKGQPLPAWRIEYDRAVAGLIAPYPFDVGMLAGYMLIFTPEMARRFPFLNLHPAEPGGPAGTWQDVIWQLIDRRAERSGVMVHLTTDVLDEGPTLTYCTYSLRSHAFGPLWAEIEGRSAAGLQSREGEASPVFAAIRRQGVARETPLVIATLHALAGGRLRIENGRVLDEHGHELAKGLDLTKEIEATIANEIVRDTT